MRRFYWSTFLSLTAILTVVGSPAMAAPDQSAPAQGTVTASAVVVPTQISDLGFLISGLAKEVPVREGDVVKAGQTLIVLDTPNLEFAVTEAEAALRYSQAQAQIRSNEIIKKFVVIYRRDKILVDRLRLGVPHEVIEMAEADVQQAQAALEIAQANLAQATLVAPHDGILTSVSVIPGEFVKANQAMVTLATLDVLQIETTDLSERDISNVHIGDAATIFVEALNESFNGKVISISPRADTVGGDVVFKVAIAPDMQPRGLLWGMTAQVEIQSGE
jgi:HlyD family secretion protein